MDFEDHIALSSVEAIAAGLAGFFVADLFAAEQTIGAGVRLDVGHAPVFGWVGHCRVDGCKKLNVLKTAKLFQLFQ